MIPTAVPNVGPQEEANLRECIASTMVSTAGPFVTDFERGIAQISETPDAVSTSSGTCALHAALMQCGVGYGDLVIVPSLTFIASANAVSHTGAQPWLFECSAESWTLDLAVLSEELERNTYRDAQGLCRHRPSDKIVRAVLPVMTMGLSLDLDDLHDVVAPYGLSIVVDAAAAIGVRPGGKALGTAPVDAICYSFNGNKTITCGGGGAIVSPKQNFLDGLRHLTTTARNGPNYDHDIVGYNYRMTNLNAAVGLAQLDRLPEFLATKIRIAAHYNELAAQYDMLGPFPEREDKASTYWFSGFYYIGDDRAVADAFRAHMRTRDIDLREFWKPLHMQQPYSDVPHTEMPVTDDIWWRIFPLPCSTNLTADELATVTKAVHDFWSAV